MNVAAAVIALLLLAVSSTAVAAYHPGEYGTYVDPREVHPVTRYASFPHYSYSLPSLGGGGGWSDDWGAYGSYSRSYPRREAYYPASYDRPDARAGGSGPWWANFRIPQGPVGPYFPSRPYPDTAARASSRPSISSGSGSWWNSINVPYGRVGPYFPSSPYPVASPSRGTAAVTTGAGGAGRSSNINVPHGPVGPYYPAPSYWDWD